MESRTPTSGDRLRLFATTRYKTLTAFAEATNTSKSEMTFYVKDERSPGAEKLRAFQAAGLSIDWYLSGIGQMDAPLAAGNAVRHEGDFRLVDVRVPENLDELIPHIKVLLDRLDEKRKELEEKRSERSKRAKQQSR